MTVQTSTIPAVRAAVKTLAQGLALTWGTAPDLQTVGVSIGEPPQGFAREAIIIGEVNDSDSDQKWSHLGFRTREEMYSLDVVIRVDVPGLTVDQAQAEAYRILAAFETAFRSAPNTNLGLGSSGVTYVEISQPSDVLVMGDEGGQCAVKFAVRVKSSLRTTS